MFSRGVSHYMKKNSLSEEVLQRVIQKDLVKKRCRFISVHVHLIWLRQDFENICFWEGGILRNLKRNSQSKRQSKTGRMQTRSCTSINLSNAVTWKKNTRHFSTICYTRPLKTFAKLLIYSQKSKMAEVTYMIASKAPEVDRASSLFSLLDQLIADCR